MPPRVGLRAKFTLSVLAFLVALLGLSARNYAIELRRAEEDALEVQMLTAGVAAAVAHRVFEDAIALGQAIAAAPVVHTMDASQVDPYLRALLPEFPQYANLTVFDSSGSNVGAAVLPPDGTRISIAPRPYFQRIMATNRPEVSDTLMGEIFLRPIAIAAVPLRDSAGSPIGAVQVVIDLDHLVASLGGAWLAGGQSILLADRSGRVAINTSRPDQSWEERDLSRVPEVQSALAGQAQRAADFLSPLTRDRRIAAFVPVAGYGWVAAATLPVDAAQDPMQDWLQRELLGYLAVSFAIGAFSLAMVRAVIRPIRVLAAGIEEFGRGERGRRVEVHTGDELESLAHAFNRMADRVRGADQQMVDLNFQLVRANIRANEHTEEVLRQAAELEAAINAIADGLVIYDLSERVVRANRVAQEILGGAVAERGTKLSEYVVPLRVETPAGQPFPEDELPVRRALRGEVVRSVVMVLHPAPDRAFWISVSAAPICGREGTVLGAITTFADITDQHGLQERLQDFMRTVSHDLRNPLTAISGQAQILLRSVEDAGLDGARRRGLETILRSAQRMNAMIQDLVDSARLESGQLQLNRQPTDLARFVAGLLERVATTVDVRRIRVQSPDDPPLVVADPDRLDRVLTNLITNALKYSATDTEVVVRFWRLNGEVVTAVSDQGVGIAPEDIPRIFERYYQPRLGRRAEGLGLGLYIARLLVEAQGGTIWVESQVGRGSTFFFTLPRLSGD